METNQIATKADIAIINEQLSEIKALLKHVPREKPVLRSADVKKLLGISDSTLQRLRISKDLPARKVNGTWFYNSMDILNIIK